MAISNKSESASSLLKYLSVLPQVPDKIEVHMIEYAYEDESTRLQKTKITVTINFFWKLIAAPLPSFLAVVRGFRYEAVRLSKTWLLPCPASHLSYTSKQRMVLFIEKKDLVRLNIGCSL